MSLAKLFEVNVLSWGCGLQVRAQKKIKASEHYFHLGYCLQLPKAGHGFKFNSVNESLVCDHSNESYWVVLSCGTVYHTVQGGPSLYMDSLRVTIQVKLLSRTFKLHWVYAIQGGTNL